MTSYNRGKKKKLPKNIKRPDEYVDRTPIDPESSYPEEDRDTYTQLDAHMKIMSLTLATRMLAKRKRR